MKNILILLLAFVVSSCVGAIESTAFDVGRKIGIGYTISKSSAEATGYVYVSREKIAKLEKCYKVLQKVVENPGKGALKDALLEELRASIPNEPAYLAARVIIDSAWGRLVRRFNIDALSGTSQIKILKEVLRGIESALDEYGRHSAGMLKIPRIIVGFSSCACRTIGVSHDVRKFPRSIPDFCNTRVTRFSC